MKKIVYIQCLVICSVVFFACKKEEPTTEEVVTFTATPYPLVVPSSLPTMPIPADNPLTVEGVALGKKLFYDPLLSGDNSRSCAGCHKPIHGFADFPAFSFGVGGQLGTRNSMPIINLAWQPQFFWDGGAADLESQAIAPIENPVEMHQLLSELVDELTDHDEYPALFKAAFGSDSVTIPRLMKAIAQFERTLISGNSRYDRYVQGQEPFTPQEILGMELFSDMSKGDCNHCHTLGSTFSDFAYRNTGLDSIPEDDGRYKITLNESDRGKFKTPSLRNIAQTAPYMHDGRFSTLLQCVEHYNTGFHYAENLDANLEFAQKGRMTPSEMEAIVAFLLTLTDDEFLTNPAHHP
jgi:cytochrome c peroxidase